MESPAGQTYLHIVSENFHCITRTVTKRCRHLSVAVLVIYALFSSTYRAWGRVSILRHKQRSLASLKRANPVREIFANRHRANGLKIILIPKTMNDRVAQFLERYIGYRLLEPGEEATKFVLKKLRI
jgi:hypothetical protein